MTRTQASIWSSAIAAAAALFTSLLAAMTGECGAQTETMPIPASPDPAAFWSATEPEVGLVHRHSVACLFAVIAIISGSRKNAFLPL